MNRKRVKGWLKHGDFILLDLLCMQFCFILSFWIFRGFHNPYMQDTNQHLAVTLFVAQLLVVLFSSSYQGILRRKKFDELIAVCKYIISVIAVPVRGAPLRGGFPAPVRVHGGVLCCAGFPAPAGE